MAIAYRQLCPSERALGATCPLTRLGRPEGRPQAHSARLSARRSVGVADARIIKLRRADTCARCSTALAAGIEAAWDAGAKAVTCRTCTEGAFEVTPGVPGRSARAESERRAAAEDERRRGRRARRPLLGRLANALDGPNTAGDTYAKGAVGEEKLGAALDGLVDSGLFVLHDRRRPRTAANIDHLVVSPGGVWVVDAKRYAGIVKIVDKGGWFHSDPRLTATGRNSLRACTSRWPTFATFSRHQR